MIPGKAALVIILFALMTELSVCQPTIAVMDFTGKGVSDSEASALTDRLRAELVEIGKYNVVEREMMNAILTEQGFQMSGCVSDKCIVAAGQILGAARMVAGSVSKVGDVYSVSARIVDVETGQIAKTATYDHRGNIGDLLIDGMPNIAGVLSGAIQAQPRLQKETPSEKQQTDRVYDDIEPLKTEGSALGFSWSVPYPTEAEDNKYFGNWMMSLEYARGISGKLLFSFDLGLGELEYTVDKPSTSTTFPPPTTSAWKDVDGRQFTMLPRLHYLLNPRNRPNVFLSAGLGGMRLPEVVEWEEDMAGSWVIRIVHEERAIILIPVGLCIDFARWGRTSFLLDFGYLFSPETGGSKPYPGPSGYYATLRTRIRL